MNLEVFNVTRGPKMLLDGLGYLFVLNFCFKVVYLSGIHKCKEFATFIAIKQTVLEVKWGLDIETRLQTLVGKFRVGDAVWVQGFVSIPNYAELFLLFVWNLIEGANKIEFVFIFELFLHYVTRAIAFNKHIGVICMHLKTFEL